MGPEIFFVNFFFLEMLTGTFFVVDDTGHGRGNYVVQIT